jgi:hypothetical protein
MAGLISAFLGAFGRGKDPAKADKPADVYQDLRQKVFALDAARIGLAPSGPNRVWGMLMETGYPKAVATLVTLGDGTVSMYFSNGGGIIGVGQHDGPRKAGAEFLAFAPQFLDEAKPTKEFPMPGEGRIRFYFLTYDGIFTSESSEDDLANKRSKLSPLFYKAHGVITQARLVHEQMKTGAAPEHKTVDSNAGAMLQAATAGDVQGLTALLKSGIPPDVADDTGLMPLMASAYTGKIQTLKLLLESGAKIDATDSAGYTALMYACNAGKTDCAELLVQRGADINHCDNDLSTPLMYASQNGYDDIVRLLLTRGADPTFKGKHGLSAIGFAHQNSHWETEKILRNGIAK